MDVPDSETLIRYVRSILSLIIQRVNRIQLDSSKIKEPVLMEVVIPSVTESMNEELGFFGEYGINLYLIN